MSVDKVLCFLVLFAIVGHIDCKTISALKEASLPSSWIEDFSTFLNEVVGTEEPPTTEPPLQDVSRELEAAMSTQESSALHRYCDLRNNLPLQIDDLDRGTYMKWLKSDNSKDFREVQVNYLEKLRDTTFNPCDNFYLYACGNWENLEHGPHEVKDAFDLLQKRIKEVWTHLMESGVEEDDTESLIKMKKFYKTCMDTEEIEARKLKPLLKFATQLGPWPIFNSKWTPNDFDWVRTVAQLQLYGVDVFFVTDLEATKVDNSDCRYAISVMCDSYKTVADYIEEIEDYEELFYDNSLYLDLNGIPLTYLKQNAAKIVEFNEDLKQIKCGPGRNRTIDLKTLREKVSEINWQDYFSILLRRPINPREPIIVEDLEYVAQIISLIKQTDLKIVADYMFLCLVGEMKNFVTVSRDQHRPADCYFLTKDLMPTVMTDYFVKHYLNAYKQNEVHSIFEDVRRALKLRLDSSPWLSEKSKSRLKKRLENVAIYTGYPSWFQENDVRYVLADFHIDTKNFFENTIKLLRFASQLKFDGHGQRPNEDYPMSECHNGKKIIPFTPELLQPPFYHEFATRSLNYASIGNLMAYMILDHVESSFDDKEVKLKYENHVICHKQRNELKETEALHISYAAYRNWTKHFSEMTSSEFKDFAALNLTKDQLFFLSYGQLFCSNAQSLCTGWKTELPLNEAVSNNRDFARAFNCPVGAPMNPKRKCSYLI